MNSQMLYIYSYTYIHVHILYILLRNHLRTFQTWRVAPVEWFLRRHVASTTDEERGRNGRQKRRSEFREYKSRIWFNLIHVYNINFFIENTCKWLFYVDIYTLDLYEMYTEIKRGDLVHLQQFYLWEMFVYLHVYVCQFYWKGICNFYLNCWMK